MKATCNEIIESLDVSRAIEEWGHLSIEEIEKPILRHAYDKNDIRAYTLATQLMLRDNRWEWHYLASMILSQALCHIQGAYFSAYHHALEACRMAPDNNSLKEFVLFFYIVPERPMPDEIAEAISSQLLSNDPENKTAKESLALLNKRREKGEQSDEPKCSK